MIVVSDSSPLVILSKLGCFSLLHRLFPRVLISAEVHHEVVIAGAGLPGSAEVEKAPWIEVRDLPSSAGWMAIQQEHGLGAGELSTILLGKDLQADAVLLDDFKARKLAKIQGLRVLGTVGILEALYADHALTDLRAVFQKLLDGGVYIDQRLLNRRLRFLRLPPL
ncbi:MAG: DUF3368 domain-containing protein [Candidatus Acidiferrum sp.]